MFNYYICNCFHKKILVSGTDKEKVPLRGTRGRKIENDVGTRGCIKPTTRSKSRTVIQGGHALESAKQLYMIDKLPNEGGTRVIYDENPNFVSILANYQASLRDREEYAQSKRI